MRSLPLTNKTRGGGRPRDTRAPRNAFADWLAGCGMTPEKVAERLGTSRSSVYNARNGYFQPGRDLAVKIERLSKGAVPVSSWADAKSRDRSSRSA